MRSQAVVDVISALSPGYDPRSQWPFAEHARRTGGKLPGPWNKLTRTGLARRIGPNELDEWGPHNLVPGSQATTSTTAGTNAPTVSSVYDATAGMDCLQLAWASGASGYGAGNAILTGDTPTLSAGQRYEVKIEIYVDRAAGLEAQVYVQGVSDAALAEYQVGSYAGPGWYTVTINMVPVSSAVARLVMYRNLTMASPLTVRIGRRSIRAVGAAAANTTTAGLSAQDWYVPTTNAARYLPRITHDPSTLAPLGMMVGGQATNVAGNTQALSSWLSGGGSVTPTANTHSGPDGNGTADTLVLANNAYIYYSIGILSSVQRVHSMFIRRGTGTVRVGLVSGGFADAVEASFDTASGAVGAAVTAGSVSSASVGAVPFGTNWWLVYATATLPATGLYLALRNMSGSTVTVVAVDSQCETGNYPTSRIPNAGTGTAVRVADSAGPGLALTSTALSDAFPGGVTAAFAGVIKYRKAYSVSSNETVFALSAGSSAGTTNLFALRTNGTQAQLVTSAGAGALSGTLVHDGSTVNKIAYSCDPASGKMSISVNGATAVETTGIAYTGSGVVALIAGSQTYAGSEPMGEMIVSEWDNSRTSYITGTSLQALSA